MKTDPALVGAVIVHYRSVGDLRDCLTSLCADATPPSHVVVVDNSEGLEDRRAAASVANKFGATHIGMATNAGYAVACNRGVAALEASVSHVLFINQDATVGANTVSRLSTKLGAMVGAGAINPVILDSEGQVWFAGGRLDRRLGRLIRPFLGQDPDRMSPFATEWLNGCVLLVDRDAFAEVGGFDERFFLYWEDVDLSLRMLERGYSIHIDHESTATHHIPLDRMGRRALRAPTIQYSVQSRLRFLRSSGSARSIVPALLYTPINAIGLVVSAARSGRSVRSVSSAISAVARGLVGGLSS